MKYASRISSSFNENSPENSKDFVGIVVIFVAVVVLND